MARSKVRTPNEPSLEAAIIAARRQSQLQEIRRTIRLAEVRCIPFDDLLGRIEQLWDDPAASEIVYRACEESLSENQIYALAESVRRLADAVDLLPSALKSTVDRAIRRILSRMPANIAGPIAAPWLEHKRKFRREVAYRILRVSGTPATCGPRLLAIFGRTGDQECLRLLARNPAALLAAGAVTVAELIDEEYWRMRILQSLLAANVEMAISLSAAYPREFVWASGRQEDAKLLLPMRALFDARSDDLDFVSLYIWALGRLGARDELLRVRELIEGNQPNA